MPKFVYAIALFAIVIVSPCRADSPTETLTAQTGKPNFSVFVPGDAVPIQLTVTGERGSEVMLIRVLDEHDSLVKQSNVPVPAGTDMWTTTFQAPNAKLGFYRVYASLPDGVTLPKMGSRSAGYLTYAIVPDPATRTMYPPSEARFGMQGGFNGSVDTPAYLGFNWVNGPGRWDRDEPEHAGQFAAKRAADRAVGRTGPSKIAGATRGYEWCYSLRDGKRVPWPIYPIFPIYNPPDWAFIEGKKVGSTAPLRPDAEQAWASYAGAFAASVAEDYANLDSHFYQITWEPNWFNGTPEQFVDIYRLAYKAIHDADPKAIVAGPTKSGVGDFNMANEATCFSLGLGSYLDAYTIHPYIAMPSERNGYLDQLPKLIAFPSAHAGKSIPVYATEQGYATGDNPAKELDQARSLIRSSLVTLGEGVCFYFGFYIHDYNGEPGFGYFYNLRDDEKFGTDRIAPKPIAPAFAAETWLIDGHQSVGSLDYLGDTALGYAFQRKGDIVLALWDYGVKPRTISLATGVANVDVYDWMGNNRTVATRGGMVSLTLTQEPIYVRGASPAIYGAGACRTLDLDKTRVTTMPGGEIAIHARLRSAGKPFTGTVTVAANRSLGTNAVSIPVFLDPQAAKSQLIALRIPNTTTTGTYVLTVQLGNSMRRVRIDVEPAVRVASITPSAIDGTPTAGKLHLRSVRVTLSSIQDVAVSGTMSLNISGMPSQSSVVTFNVQPNCDSVVEIPCCGMALIPGARYHAVLTANTANGVTFSRRISLGVMSAPPELGAAIPLDGPTRGSVRIGWSANGLLLTAAVPDTQSTPAKLDLAIDLDPSKVERSTGDLVNDLLARRRYTTYAFDLDGSTPRATRTYSFDGNKLHYGKLYDWQLPLKIGRDGLVTTYAATIPWKELAAETAPAPGSVIGLAITANGGAYTLFGGVPSVENKGDLGSVVLVR